MSLNKKINILPENIANKIAAGEVIQRPESAVKELLENSIDAGADSIEVVVKRAGKILIQVCDNGIGMSPEDAIDCIKKHATSKITIVEDLDSIRTLGFRGEALSSIAAVAQLEIRTERNDDEIGCLIKYEDSIGVVKEAGSFAKGTCVSVKNLFYNIPARRNFLRSDATELKHILDTFNKISLSHPQISFRFFNDDDLIFDYKSGTLEERIMQVFADNILDALIPVQEHTEYLNLKGYVSKPAYLKRSKGEQYVFLNNRYVISRQINHAVFSAYENILEKGDFPFFIIFIELDPKKVDVNVHPSKLEVRFDDEKDIYSFVRTVVRKGLGSFDLVPSLKFIETTNDGERTRFDKFTKTDVNDFSDRPVFEAKHSTAKSNFSDKEIDLIFSTIPDDILPAKPGEISTHPFEQANQNTEVKTERSFPSSPVSEETPFIIQLHNKYILSQIKSGLMIIDQHVAHERILYEKVLNRLDANIPFSQQLLFPRTVELNPGTFGLLKEIYPMLARLGFDVKFFSKQTIVIEGVPDDIKNGSEEVVLKEIIDEYISNSREKKLEETENIAKSYSCKAAIKAGDKLSDREMRLLIDQLFATSMPYVCPHGRPIVVKISLDEFDRRFGRT